MWLRFVLGVVVAAQQAELDDVFLLVNYKRHWALAMHTRFDLVSHLAVFASYQFFHGNIDKL